jgi:pimeloyl-ACP methyl ester carboxylesterase
VIGETSALRHHNSGKQPQTINLDNAFRPSTSILSIRRSLSWGDMPRREPSALSDPPAYLSGAKFNRRITCPRTNLPVSFSDTGDPKGIPLLWILPSGCSRWFAAPQDPLASLFGVRLIAVDRPGVGATPVVPLEDRIRISCRELLHRTRCFTVLAASPVLAVSPVLGASDPMVVLIESVLEHLQVKLAHLLATSAGI